MPPFLLILLAWAGIVQAEPEFRFGTDWRGERIELPPGFAPAMGWQGVEVIRFAPGMFQPDTESFFTYALVFLLAEGSDVSPDAIQREVLIYYRGLAKAVSGGNGEAVETGAFTLKLGTPVEADGFTETTGSLDWIEPFATRRPQTLNLEIRQWTHGRQPVLFFAVSPQPAAHPVWNQLRQIRDQFRLED